MSVEEHRKKRASEPARFAVLVVSTSRDLDQDVSGRRIVEMLVAAGHEVMSRTRVSDDIDAIRGAVDALAGVDAIVVTGGTGLALLDVTPEALQPMFSRRIDGFGELFRMLSWEQIGAAAMLSRATAGVLPTGAVVFALPGSVKACELAMERLILPEIGHLVGLVGAASTVAKEDRPETTPVAAHAVPEEGGRSVSSEPAALAPAGKLGRLGGLRTSVGVTQPTDGAAPSQEGGSERGWQRAVQDLRGTVKAELREEVPQPIEKLAPVLNVLESAGQVAVLELPGGRRYGLYGWPDLERPASKVLAIGWGQPMVEVLALHRHPVATGTCIDEPHGQLPYRHESLAAVCEAVTGRAPREAQGAVFAVAGDAVWIERDGRVSRWDGRAMREEGNLKQALATLLIDWHQR